MGKQGVFLLSCLFLAWCWTSVISSSTQTIAFDGYTIEIPNTFSPINSALVENKQILNKVLKSFKKTVPSWFASNIVISRSSLPPELDYEQFWSANSKKLSSYLVNYQPGEQRLISFTCGEKTIKGILVTFQVANTFVGNSTPYWLAQYQFVSGRFGYIISYASADENELQEMIEWVDDIACTWVPAAVLIDSSTWS